MGKTGAGWEDEASREMAHGGRRQCCVMSHPANHICQKSCEIILVSDILITCNKWLVVFRGQDLQSQGFTWAICSQGHMASRIPINSHLRHKENNSSAEYVAQSNRILLG
jgi:hypothetical protein